MLLQGLQSLLDFYLPALLSLGIKVRRLYWEGRLGGTVQGNLAKRVLSSSVWHCTSSSWVTGSVKPSTPAH